MSLLVNKIRSLFHRRPVTAARLLDELQEQNSKIMEGQGLVLDKGRAVASLRDIRGTLSSLYGMQNEDVQDVVSAGAAYHLGVLRAQAGREHDIQAANWNKSVNATILAGQGLAEDTLQLEGDVFAATVAPIELGMNARVWVSGPDESMVSDINDRLKAWRVMDTINSAWQDMETYSAYYVTHRWDDGVPTPIHWSPKRIWVGPDTGYGPYEFLFLPLSKGGDEIQTEIEFGEVPGSKEWNDWAQSMAGKPLPIESLVWEHFLKPRHKMYPYPWLAKAATPVYTRQIIEEMRLALVQGVMNQLWVMTIEDPLPGEVARLKEVIGANRAERVGYLLWRKGLAVDVYGPEAIESLLLPEAWWTATLDIFRRIGRTIRIVSGEGAQRTGQSGTDAEIDVRVAQNKAMAHRALVAEKMAIGLLRQWGGGEGGKTVAKAVSEGKLTVHTTPIELFLGEALKDIWGPMYDRGMASIRTIHASLGIETDAETQAMKAEKAAGFDEIYVARQQFAQRVATPGGDVTRSQESKGRPPDGQVSKASVDLTERLHSAFDRIDETDESEEREKLLVAFIALLTALLRAHMREAYAKGYAAAGGIGTVDEGLVDVALEWEQQYIDGFADDLAAAIHQGLEVSGPHRYRVQQHVQASWKRAYMDGAFQAKAEDGWLFWQRVLRPWASKSGPCEICTEDSKRWHPIDEPFWDHPYGVCSMQVIRFMRTSTDGWQAYDRQMVPVPLVE